MMLRSRCVRAANRQATHFFLLFLCLPALLLAQAGLANAQQTPASVPIQSAPSAPSTTSTADSTNPVVHLQAADLRHFTSAFAALSEQGKVAFVAEGKPFVSTLSGDDLDKLAKSLPTGEAATLREVTDLVAHAYDYDVVRTPTQPGLVLLVKCYSNPKDFPQISYEEAERSLHNILLATNPLNPRLPFGTDRGFRFKRFYASLSPEQQKKEIDPISISSMRPEQRQLVWQMAHEEYFDSLYSFDRVYEQLRGLEDPRTEFCWMDWTAWLNSSLPLFVFGWEGPFGPNHGNHKTAISHNLSKDLGGASVFDGYKSYQAAIASGFVDAKTGRLLKPLPDDVTAPASANSTNATPEKIAAEPQPNTLTLREAVQRLNETAASALPQSDGNRFRANVDDALARKTVTLIGAQNISSFNLLDAFSRVYGLWIVAQKDKSFLLTLRAPRPCKEAADVPQEIRRLFPEPMWRMSESGARNYENSDEANVIKKRREERTAKMPKELLEGYLKGAAGQDAFMADFAKYQMRVHAAQVMHVESIRRIRALVEPRVPKDSGKRLPVVEVGDKAHDALTIFHLTQATQALESFLHSRVPLSIVHFDRAFIQARFGLEEGPDWVGYSVGYFDEKNIPRPDVWRHFQIKP